MLIWEDSILSIKIIRSGEIVKKLSSVLATFVLIPAGVSGNLVASNEITSSGNLTFVTINTEKLTHTFRTSSKDVREVLSQNKIAYGEFDSIEPSLDSKLDGNPITVTIKEALPVLIMDENLPIKVFSGYTEVDKILKQHKIKVKDEDKIEESLITDFAKEGWVGPKIQINRAPKVNVNVDGAIIEVRTWGKTVKEALDGKGIVLGDKDKVNPSPETIITNGLEVDVIRVAESVVKKTVSVLRTTAYQDSYDLLKGQQEILDEGKDGQKEQTFKVIFENGKVTEQTLISENVIKGVTPRIIKRGKKPHNPNDYWPIIVEAGKKYGVDPADMYCVMLKESGGRYNAVDGTGLYVGLFQWENNSWPVYAAKAGYAGADRTNSVAQIFATAYRVTYGGTGWAPWPNTARMCGCR